MLSKATGTAFVAAPGAPPLLQGSPTSSSFGRLQRSAPPAASHGAASHGGAWPYWLALAPLAASRPVQRRRRRARVVTLAAEGVSCKTAFLFPGQGAQKVGMCKELADECPAAKELFDKASSILGYDLLERCVNGPKELLDTTAVSQPAIFVASMAAVEKMKQDMGEAAVEEATVAMGLSLGEYSALCFAGALDFEDGVRITKARGEAMQAAADAVDSGMVSVIGLDSAKTEELCKKASEDSGKTVQIANFLCKGNYTVSGDKEACEKLVEIAKPEFKARMAVPLAVAGAFHTDFMAPAVDKLKEALAAANFKSPRIPVVSNVDAEAHSDPDEIREILAKQVTSPVKWEQQMQSMVAGGFEKGYELGPGKVIAGILKRIDRGAAGAITNFTA
uniref:Acyl carrier protein s-malonyltransacylase n=1 Tax=Gambierdiscus excentricus TaxID=986170 RepID=A0A1S6K7Y5_9DINO|nr:Acyl carrier protein s-malonyltransacylase [Gambierdiscus excentricus]